MKRLGYCCIFMISFFFSCDSTELQVVTVADFREFVEATGYVTDAEKFGWSFIQNDVDHYDIVYGIDWRCANGMEESKGNFPVTQVSFEDAQAYAKWKGTGLPNYQEYWELTNAYNDMINRSTTSILPHDQCHIIGNVWEITSPDKLGRIRLAGGSYLCAPDLCNGTSPDRELYVDKITGNSHIGFAVISKN